MSRLYAILDKRPLLQKFLGVATLGKGEFVEQEENLKIDLAKRFMPKYGIKIEEEVKFLETLIGVLQTTLRSEIPADYGVNTSATLDVFAWDKVEQAKTANSSIHFVIEQLRGKISEYQLKIDSGIFAEIN